MRWRALLDMLYPRTCIGCEGDASPDHLHVCWDCLADIPYIGPPYCSLCGDPIEGKVDHEFVCYSCSDSPPHFERARSAARYRGVMQNALRQFKYNKSLWAADDLADIMKSCALAHYDADEIDAVCYVPLHAARQRQRGFNQSRVLAHALAKRLKKPLLGSCLLRVRPTRTQTNLTAQQRATNVKGAFRPWRKRRLKGRRLLLVDDVMTTGATVNECARVLKEGGAEAVSVITVARG